MVMMVICVNASDCYKVRVHCRPSWSTSIHTYDHHWSSNATRLNKTTTTTTTTTSYETADQEQQLAVPQT